MSTIVSAFKITNANTNAGFEGIALGFIKIKTVYIIATIAAPRKFPFIMLLL